WAEPKLVVEVRFNEWTRTGKLRQPVFLGLRDDKDPSEVVREPSMAKRGHGGAEGSTAAEGKATAKEKKEGAANGRKKASGKTNAASGSGAAESKTTSKKFTGKTAGKPRASAGKP